MSSMRFHIFAAFMVVVCAVVRAIQGLPTDWAQWLCVPVGLVGAYVLFFHIIKFFQAELEKNGFSVGR